MYRVKAVLEGIVPMKINQITEITLDDILPGREKKKRTPQELADDWVNKSYKDEKGYYIPFKMLQGALNKGMCTPIPIKSNRIKMTKARAKGTIFVQTDGYIHYKDKRKVEPTKDVNVFPRPDGQLIASTRPMFAAGWLAEFEIFIAQDWLNLSSLREGLEQTGQAHGLGSNRPGFGRFIVKKLEAIG